MASKTNRNVKPQMEKAIVENTEEVKATEEVKVKKADLVEVTFKRTCFTGRGIFIAGKKGVIPSEWVEEYRKNGSIE